MCSRKKSRYRFSHILTHPYYIEILQKYVRHVHVPLYDTLSIKQVCAFLSKGHEHVFKYWPDDQEFHKVSRDWLFNVCASVLKTTFTDWVKERCDERHEVIKEKDDMNIEFDPDVADAFRASNAVSGK